MPGGGYQPLASGEDAIELDATLRAGDRVAARQRGAAGGGSSRHRVSENDDDDDENYNDVEAVPLPASGGVDGNAGGSNGAGSVRGFGFNSDGTPAVDQSASSSLKRLTDGDTFLRTVRPAELLRNHRLVRIC
jgi:hypothetical protein